MQERLKSLFTPLVILLALLLAFGLGRLTKIQEAEPVLTISNTQTNTSQGDTKPVVSQGRGGGGVLGAETATNPNLGKYVGSKSGTKYHYPWCSGAKRINEANKIWFQTIAEAETRGYSKAANCPGL